MASLGYRLAHAMLATEAGATEAVAAALRDLHAQGDAPPSWGGFIGIVHRTAVGLVADHRAELPAAMPEPAVPTEEDTIGPPGPTIHAAFAALNDADRTVLWATLLGRNVAADSTNSLARALHHLETAIRNEAIPDDGGFEWTE